MENAAPISLISSHLPISGISSPSWDIDKILSITALFFAALTMLDVSLRFGSFLAKIVAVLNPTIGLSVLVICLVAAGAIYYHKKSFEHSEKELSEMDFHTLSQNYTMEQLTKDIFTQETGNLSLAALQEKFRQNLLDFITKKLDSFEVLFHYDLDDLEKYNICPTEFIRECKDLKEKLEERKARVLNEASKLNASFLAKGKLKNSLASTRDTLSSLRSIGNSNHIASQAAALPLVLTIGAHIKYSESSQNVDAETEKEELLQKIGGLRHWYSEERQKIQEAYEEAYSRHFPQNS